MRTTLPVGVRTNVCSVVKGCAGLVKWQLKVLLPDHDKSWYLLSFQHQAWLPLAESVSSPIRELLDTTKVDMALLHP